MPYGDGPDPMGKKQLNATVKVQPNIKQVTRTVDVNVDKLQEEIVVLEAEEKVDLTKTKPDEETLAFWNNHFGEEKTRVQRLLKQKKDLLNTLK